MTLYSKITGTGSYLPANRVTNEALATQQIGRASCRERVF